MLYKYWPFIVLLIFLILGLGLLQVVQNYKAEQKRRVQELQNKAKEVKVTIIEGWRTDEIAKKIEDAGLFSKKDFVQAIHSFDHSIYPLIQKPLNTNLEGYLFPDTYRFAVESTTDDIIKKFLDNFHKRLSSIGVQSAKDNILLPDYPNLIVKGGDNIAGLSLYDILTLASIIEQESGGSSNMSLAEERAIIAGVFYNRLSIGQALESDATVNYITGKNDPGVSIGDTKINSPYNTYQYPGLPPGPIGNPSLGSIEAALHPKKSDYYYFLHKQPSGEVQFSKTFIEHVRKKQ